MHSVQDRAARGDRTAEVLHMGEFSCARACEPALHMRRVPTHGVSGQPHPEQVLRVGQKRIQVFLGLCSRRFRTIGQRVTRAAIPSRQVLPAPHPRYPSSPLRTQPREMLRTNSSSQQQRSESSRCEWRVPCSCPEFSLVACEFVWRTCCGYWT